MTVGWARRHKKVQVLSTRRGGEAPRPTGGNVNTTRREIQRTIVHRYASQSVNAARTVGEGGGGRGPLHSTSRSSTTNEKWSAAVP